MAAIRCNITIEEEILVRVDDFADKHGMTRSGLIVLALEKYMDAQEMMPDAKSILSGFAKLLNKATNGSEEDLKQSLDAVENSYNKFMGQL